MKRIFVAVFLGGLAFNPPAFAFGFNDLEKLEKEEQADLLQKARNAANSENFSGARSYLDQARNKGFTPKQVSAVAALIASKEAAKAERDRQEAAARQAEAARQQALAAAPANQGNTNSSRDTACLTGQESDCYQIVSESQYGSRGVREFRILCLKGVGNEEGRIYFEPGNNEPWCAAMHCAFPRIGHASAHGAARDACMYY